MPILVVRCTKCEERLSPDQFGTNRSRATGLTYWCKKCCKEYRDEYRARPEVKEARRLVSKRYLADPEHRRKANERTKAFRVEHHRTRVCLVDNCDRLNAGSWHYCNGHQMRISQYGDPLAHIPIGAGTRLYPGEPCWVYQALDAHSVIRYIGITGVPNRRVSEHRGRSWWFSQVADWQWEKFPSVTEALAEESRLIGQHMRTIYNRQQMPEGLLV